MLRRQIVDLVRAGRSPAELAKEFEPTAQSIHSWIGQADRDDGRRIDGLTSSERDELSRLRRENRQLKLERAILSKAMARFARESAQNTLPGGLPGFGGGRPVDNIITAGIGDRSTSGNGNGVSEADLPGNIALHPTSDTGFSNSDNTTGDATPLLTGKAPANTIVTITSNLGGILGTATADENGQWRFTAPTLSDGVHELIATPKDEDGNEGVPSKPLLATIDTLAPDTPPAPTFDGDIDQLRSNDAPRFKGKAEPGARIVLTSDPDGVVGEVIADESGNWQMTTGPLSENARQLRLTATDATGNTSATSPALELVVRGEDDTELNFDSTSPVLVNITGTDGSVGFDPINITALLSGFTDQVDASHSEPTRSGERAYAQGFMRRLQKAGNIVKDHLLSSI